MEEDTGIFGKFDLMYGVTRAESFHMLSDAHAKMGFSVQHRNHLVNAYVRNNYENFVSLAGTTTHFLSPFHRDCGCREAVTSYTRQKMKKNESRARIMCLGLSYLYFHFFLVDGGC